MVLNWRVSFPFFWETIFWLKFFVHGKLNADLRIWSIVLFSPLMWSRFHSSNQLLICVRWRILQPLIEQELRIHQTTEHSVFTFGKTTQVSGCWDGHRQARAFFCIKFFFKHALFRRLPTVSFFQRPVPLANLPFAIHHHFIAKVTRPKSRLCTTIANRVSKF